MLQFKNGQFQQIAAESVIPGTKGNDADIEEIKSAGFEQWELIGDRDGFSLEIFRKHAPETERTEWYIEISSVVVGYPDIYCDSDADFMTLFMRLGPLATAVKLDIVTSGIQEACDAIRRRRDKDYYYFSDLLVELVNKR